MCSSNIRKKTINLNWPSWRSTNVSSRVMTRGSEMRSHDYLRSCLQNCWMYCGEEWCYCSRSSLFGDDHFLGGLLGKKVRHLGEQIRLRVLIAFRMQHTGNIPNERSCSWPASQSHFCQRTSSIYRTLFQIACKCREMLIPSKIGWTNTSSRLDLVLEQNYYVYHDRFRSFERIYVSFFYGNHTCMHIYLT